MFVSKVQAFSFMFDYIIRYKVLGGFVKISKLNVRKVVTEL